MLIEAGRDRIRTLRAVGAQRDSLALRLALERALGMVELRPQGLPPGAIICVRHMRVAMPSRNSAEWAAGLDRHVQQLLPGIVRPFRESVPADAIAVLFADEAELLACLSRDWARGVLERWWWRSLFGTAVSQTLVERSLARSPTLVPAALEMLTDSGAITDVLRALPPTFCERLCESVAAMFAVTDWLHAEPQNHTRFDPIVPQQFAEREMSALVTSIGSALAGAIGERASEVQALSSPQRTLLGLALVLRRAPALAREPGFGRTLREDGWVANSTTPTARESDAARVSSKPTDGMTSRAPLNARAVLVTPLHLGTDDGPRDREAQDTDGAGRENANGTGRPMSSGDVESNTAAVVPEAAVESPERQVILRTAGLLAPAPGFVHSQFAGVFYLVNLAIYLELYGDFTQPARPGIALPPGDFLALVGERACGAALREDGVWDLLAQLANRTVGEPPGALFMMPGRLEVWLEAIVNGLEARAALALGVEQGTALSFLCSRTGRIALTSARVDVIFPLAAHPLAIRVAGLDRNPGWLPAAGCVFEFHYE